MAVKTEKKVRPTTTSMERPKPDAADDFPTARKVIRLDDPTLAAFGTVRMKIEGTSPLIVHRFGQKAQRMILEKQMGRASKKKAPRDPDADFLESIHFIGNTPASMEEFERMKATLRYGMPADAFKASAVRGAKLGDVAMTDARTMFFVEPDVWGNLVEIASPEPPRPRQDHVRITGTSDVRIRAEFEHWSASLRVTYHGRAATAEQIVGWFVAAGKCVGIGEWRPFGRQSSGVFGRWNVTKAEADVPKLD